MFSSFIVSSMTPISFLFSLSTGSFWELFASTSDSVDCFPSTKSASNPQAYHRCFLLFSPVQYKALLPLFQFFRKLLWCCYSFLIMRVNGNLQTTTNYRRCSVLWLSHSRLNNSSLIDKKMTKAAIFHVLHFWVYFFCFHFSIPNLSYSQLIRFKEISPTIKYMTQRQK